MNKQTEALKLALEALRGIAHAMPFPVANKTIEAIKEALAQPEQKPVAITRVEDGYIKIDYLADPFPVGPLYAIPQPCPTCKALARTVMMDQTAHDVQRKPLSCETLRELWCDAATENNGSGWFVISEVFARSIEAAHGIKEQQ